MSAFPTQNHNSGLAVIGKLSAQRLGQRLENAARVKEGVVQNRLAPFRNPHEMYRASFRFRRTYIFDRIAT